MNRPAIVLAAVLIALVLLPAVVAALVHPGDVAVYELGHAADHVPTYPPGMAPIDHTPVVDPADQTTTTAAKRRSRQGSGTWMIMAAGATADAADQRRGYPCGGDLPPCWVLERESMMAADPPRVWNGNCYMPTGSTGQCGSSTASGLWQFLRSTWAGFGGYLNAADAPVDVQNDKARQLWAAGAGCSHWNACT